MPRIVPAADALSIALYILGYVFLLLAAFAIVSVLLARVTREDREAERRRRQRR